MKAIMQKAHTTLSTFLLNVIALLPIAVLILHEDQSALGIRGARPMQLYTIQLPGDRYHPAWSGYHAWAALYAYYHGIVGIYWNSRRARPTNHEFRDRAIDKRRRCEQRCANAKKKKNANVHTRTHFAPRGWIGRCDRIALFTYPARISPALLPAGAHLLWFHAGWFALTRIPFPAHSVCYHANLHFLQHVCSLVWNTMAIV